MSYARAGARRLDAAGRSVVASARALGARDREFESPRPDQTATTDSPYDDKDPLMRSGKLVLRKENLTALDTDELAAVVGGSHQCVTYSKVVTGCVCSGIWPSLNVDCPVGTLNC